MIEILFYTFACALLMRMKGGGIINPEADGKLCSALCFEVLIFGTTGNPLLGLLAGGAWFIGCSPAVRDYLTNLGGYKGPLAFKGWGQHKIVAKICAVLAHLYFHGGPTENKKLRQFYGWVGTTLRGLAMGVPLAVAFGSWSLIFAGLVMAPTYYAGISAWQYDKEHPEFAEADGWSLGEWFWGAAIGLAVAIVLGA